MFDGVRNSRPKSPGSANPGYTIKIIAVASLADAIDPRYKGTVSRVLD